MAERPNDALGAPSAGPGRPRPRPAGTADADQRPSQPHWSAPPRGSRRRGRGRAGGLARLDPAQPAQVVAAAGSAIVTAARVGRLFGRSGWRIAKQLPGAGTLEHQALKLGQVAAGELNRLLQMPQHVVGSSHHEEQRVMTLVQDAGSDPAPLRTAMTELLDRSAQSDGEQSREYLFGTIVSQLVPDEARMLAALAIGATFAALDVLSRQDGRSGRTHVVLSNASTLGAAAGIATPQNTPTYLSRLNAFGLVEFTRPDEELDPQFESLRSDPVVTEARAEIDRNKRASSKVTRKAVSLSPLGREFWDACAPPPSRQ